VGMGIYFSGHFFDKDISLSLGFSRDGFATQRPVPRFDFARPMPLRKTYYPSFSGGLLCVYERHLAFYISTLELRNKTDTTRADTLPDGNPHSFRPRVDIFHLRRDGFASLAVAPTAAPTSVAHRGRPTDNESVPSGTVVTKPLDFSRGGKHLFVNVRVPDDGLSRIVFKLLHASATDGASSNHGHGAALAASIPMTAIDSTAVRVQWKPKRPMLSKKVFDRPPGVPLAAEPDVTTPLQGLHPPHGRLAFELRGAAELYSFWISDDTERGASGGKLPPCVPPLRNRAGSTSR